MMSPCILNDMTDLNSQFEEFLKTHTGGSHSELQQEKFVLMILKNKPNGFFVEFGAMDGLRASNTYFLETAHGWQGIVSEPNPRHRDNLSKNRRCQIDFRCVSDQSGQRVQFATASESGFPGMVGHIYREQNTRGEVVEIETVNLNELLDQCSAPDVIDYISVDTDGSEPMIMRAYDFSRRRVNIWTIEHNQEPWREEILDLMEKNNYTRVLVEKSRYDDWYVHNDILKGLV